MNDDDTTPTTDDEKPPRETQIDPKTGKFLPGNSIARGRQNPQLSLRNKLHSAFLMAVGEDRLAQAIERHLELIQKASPRDAARLLELLYQYCLGKPQANITHEVSHNEKPAPLTLDASDLEAIDRIRSRMNSHYQPPELPPERLPQG